MRRANRFVVLSLLVATFAFAQQHGPLPPLTERIDVNVINVEVTVTDEKGQAVTDLTRDDFELYEDGAPQKISNFYIIQDAVIRTPGAPAPQPTEEMSADPHFRRKVVLLVDNNYIEKPRRNAALNMVEKFLAEQFNGQYDLCVAAISSRVEVVQPFTSDPAAIKAAIAKVRRMPSFVNKAEMDRSILSDRTRRAEFAEAYDYAETVRFVAREQTFRNLTTVRQTARAVIETAHAFSADEGRKLMILLTGGMENNTSFTAYQSMKDRELSDMQKQVGRTIDAMVRQANAANFTVYVVNARFRGMAAPQHGAENRSSGLNMTTTNLLRRGGGTDPIDVSDPDSMPLTVAQGTGGLYFPSAQIANSLSAIDKHSSNFYSLGYRPGHNADRQFHSIKVRVKRPGVKVTHRLGYVDLSPEDRLEDMLRMRPSISRPPGSVPVTVQLGVANRVSGKVVVPVIAAMPMQKVTLIPRDGTQVGRVHIYLSVFDRNGNNVGFHHKMQEVTLSEAQVKNVESEAFRYHMNVRLGEGNYTVVITMRDDLSNELGSATQTVSL